MTLQGLLRVVLGRLWGWGRAQGLCCLCAACSPASGRTGSDQATLAWPQSGRAPTGAAGTVTP